MRTCCTLLFALTLAGMAAAPVIAQKRPDFSGTWEEDESQRKSPYTATQAGGAKAINGPPPPLVVVQTAERITIERHFMTVTRFVYDFDGRENVNRTGAQVHTTRSRWEGDRFIIEGTIFQVTSQGETSWKLKEVHAMTPRGEMAVERTQVDEDGVAGTVYRLFRKKKR